MIYECGESGNIPLQVEVGILQLTDCVASEAVALIVERTVSRISRTSLGKPAIYSSMFFGVAMSMILPLLTTAAKKNNLIVVKQYTPFT